jgi:hypothetical protein
MDISLDSIINKISEQYQLSKNHLKEIQQKSSLLIKRHSSRNSQKNLDNEINEFLFTPEELPPFSKEYWFMLFTGLNENYKDQLVLTFGRNTRQTMSIDEIEQSKDGDGYLGGISAIWYYMNGHAKKFGKKPCKIFLDGKSVKMVRDDFELILKGLFPNYTLLVHNKEGETIKLDLSLAKHGDSLEFYQFFKGNFGFDLGNTYLDFKGHINNQHFNGRSYVQKVVVTAPFLPWYWGRIIFENGSVLVLFKVWLEIGGAKKTMFNRLKFINSKTSKETIFEDFDHYNVVDTNYWITTAKNEENQIFVLFDVYVNDKFHFKSRGELIYNEMFAEVKEIRVNLKDEKLEQEELGHGVGSLEETKGIVF